MDISSCYVYIVRRYNLLHSSELYIYKRLIEIYKLYV